jgi:hypothetical protein
MCVVTENPRRRHRPAYLAPARNTAVMDLPPPPPPPVEDSEPVCKSLYQSLVDFLLLVAVLCMSFFLYDVEITITKEEGPIRQSDVVGSRVLWRREEQEEDHDVIV